MTLTLDVPPSADASIERPMLDWFAREGWAPFDFQRQTWQAYLAGRGGLVHAPTGSGKTLAVFGGPVLEEVAISGSRLPGQRSSAHAASQSSPGHSPATPRRRKRESFSPLTVLWLTPLRALANDTAHALQRAVTAADLRWNVELRTSDTSASLRSKQRGRLPSVLVTTPESLSVLLSYPDSSDHLRTLRAVIVDEWHELLSTKRGVQTELGIARLRALSAGLRVWGLSATMGNLDEAMRVLLGPQVAPHGELVHAQLDKEIVVQTIFPPKIERFPWAGHAGLQMLDPVAAALDDAASTLVFTNTRSQSEVLFRALLNKRPDLVGQIGVHHGSLDRKIRAEVEQMLRAGRLRAVVCTSSLDLGVDFTTVEQVMQVGSPKGVARLMQRAGRSGHRPGEPSVVRCVPAHAFELIEFSAAREGIERRQIESRRPLPKPLDVLAQHVVTRASGGGFDESELLAEARSTHAYADLTDDEWRWVMEFASQGGASLGAYDRFKRITRDDATGHWHIASPQMAKMHRINIGTIVSDGVVALELTTGKRLGTIEELFISRLKPGDHFVFAGRTLQLVGIREMTARVRIAKRPEGMLPQWAGQKFPLSTQLASIVRRRIEQAGRGQFVDDEMRAVAPLMAIQARWSIVPTTDEVLLERVQTREGVHHFLFGFLGRLVHEGLGAVLAHRLMKRTGHPVSATFNDYGIELLSPPEAFEGRELTETDWRELLTPQRLTEDLLACLNTGELTRRQFREIARVAGLVLAMTPGQPRSNRQLQASSELFYDVFAEFDPQNLLLEQARREVLERQLEFRRLIEALEALQTQRIVYRSPPRLTPMAFPIWAQRIGSQTLRAEAAKDRIERMVATLERAAQREKDL